MNNVDDYLIHEFAILDEERRIEESLGEGVQPERPLLPMLLRVRGNTRWRPKEGTECTVIAQLENIVACFGSTRTLEALQRDPRVISIEASRPTYRSEAVNSLSFVRADRIHRAPLQERGDKALIAIIDDGIDVLHHAFRDASGKRTRILALWDQTDPTGPAPELGGDRRIGTLYTEKQLNGFLANPRSLPASLQEIREFGGHGTHVASIAAGRAIAKSGFSGGVAPDAKLIVVVPSLEVKAGDLLSLGYSISHTAALTFIDAIAKRRRLPVVVNLSQGMNAGAHDGTSDLEAAFDQFTQGGREPGRVIVKSAGNERNKGGHAKLFLNSNQRIVLRWCSLFPEGHDTQPAHDQMIIEVWFKACDEVKFCLRNPLGEVTPQVTTTSTTRRGRFHHVADRYHLSYTRYFVDNGDSRLLVTLTAAAGNASVLAGEWQLIVDCDTIRSSGVMHAWAERLAGPAVRFKNYVDEEATLSIPGTAHTVICVSSINASMPFSVAASSSSGPTRDGRDKPELCAPGESITAAKGNSLMDLITMSGTSMAAPHVTGAIVLLFSYWEKKIQGKYDKRLNAAQIRAAISQTTQNFNSHWSSDTGYGVLDIESLFAAFQ